MTSQPGSNRTALVVGAGVVGTACALALQRRGMRVTLMDRAGPGEQCSFGNAGRIAVTSVAPRSTPGLLWQIPRMLADRRHPLKVSPGHLLRSWPWFARFLRAGRADRVGAIADALHALCVHADGAFDEMVSDVGAGDVAARTGVMYVYRDPANAAAARAGFAYAVERGIRVEEIDGDRAREIEPALPAGIRHAFHRPGDALVRNPLRLTQAMARCFAERGGRLVREEARGFEAMSEGAPRVITATGGHRADTVVVAAGAWSGTLAARLGVTLPMQAERGYHAELRHAGVDLRMPIHFGDRYLSFSPMENGLRVGSGAQFAPVDAPPDWRRLDVVLEGARTYYPDLDTRGHTRWMGGRPSTPDSLPAIGPSRAHPNVIFACGHGMLGLTFAALTGRLVAAAATGAPPELDLTPYRPDRF